MPRYLVTLSSGRDLVMETSGDAYDVAYDALEEAALMDDYLVDVEEIDDEGVGNSYRQRFI